LTLTWTALFVLSLLLQYFSFAAAPPALAAHDVGLFELDGNADDQPAPGADWENGPEGAADSFFAGAASEAPANDNTYFTTGGSKDENDVSSWKRTTTSAPDKNELLDAYAAVYQAGGDTWVYFGADRFDNDGTAQIGFWFFQNDIGLSGSDFTGVHKDGDVLIISEYTNGGVVSTICAYTWDSAGGGSNIANAAGCDPATKTSHLNLVAAGAECDVADGTFDICAVTNADTENAPWTFLNKDGDTDFGPGQFFEGGINLSDMFGGNAPCFGTFLAETRTSAETDAQLKDFALGDFDTCVPPTIETQSSTGTADFGQQVTDTATFSGSNGAVTGTAKFFICTPAQVTAAGCPEGAGSQVGVAKTISSGTATSDAYTVGLTAAAAGKYCWRAEYTPDAGSDYKAGSHTNAGSECFTVAPATIDVTKTANPAGPVNAGDQIGFDITVTNNGTNTTLGVSLTDNLPAGVDWSNNAPTGSTANLSCAITGPVGTEVLTCTKPSLAAGASFSIHVFANTDATDCGTINNTANVSTSNDGTDSASASVVVNCPDVKVTKTPDGGTVNAGDPITWTIKVENIGAGVANGVILTDNLPSNVDWSEGETDCTITGAVGSEVLTCQVGTLQPAGQAGSSKTYQVTGTTDGADCGVINNTGSATATNEPSNVLVNNSDSGSVTVTCAQIDIVKDANPVGPVSAGDEIGWDITVSNNGNGAATNVHVSDNLPDGVTWTADLPTGDTDGVVCAIVSNDLVCDDPSMAAGDSFTVHVHGLTDAADCGTINNTATVTTGNDGQDSDGASVVVQCPDVTVLKTADNSPINAGDTAAFTIVVSNAGPGIAKNVHVSDPLPAGVNWAINPAVTGCSIAAGTLTCDFATLGVGAGAAITIHVSGVTDAADCGTLPNTVTVSATNEPQGATGNNQSSASIVVNCPDVTVEKTADNSPINAGDEAAFTITVSNAGPGVATNVHVSDPLPAGVSWAIDPAVTGCSIAASTLTCDFATLGVGAGNAIVIHVSGVTDADDCGTLPNTVTVSASNEPEKNTGNNSDSASIVVNCPDVTVEKTADNSPISAGENAAFTITVSNDGPGVAYDVTLDDSLPAGIAWSVSAVFKNGSPIANPCDPIAGGVLHCDLGDLAVDDEVVIHIGGETDFEDCGTVHNEVVVGASNEAEEDTDNNDAEADIVVNCPELGIVKTADHSEAVVAGNPIGFTVTVANNGSGTAFGVTATDTLDAGFSWSIESQDGGWSLVGNLLTFGPANLAPGGEEGSSSSVHVVADTDFEDCGLVPNTAFVFNNVTEVPVDDDSAAEEVRCPEIDLVKNSNDEDGIVDIGQTVTFTILAQVAEGPVTDAVITDVLPDGQTYVDGSQSSSPAEDSFTVSPDGKTLTWTYASLNDGDPAVTITYDVTIDEGATGELTNVAEICVSELPNCESDDETVTPQPEIDVDKSVDDEDGIVDIGQTVTFTILGTVANNPVTDGVITDVLPEGQTYVDGSQSSNPAETTFTVSPDGQTLTWTYADLGIGDPAVTITYDVTIDAGAEGELTNVVEFCVAEVEGCANDDETVTPQPEIGIDKSSDDEDGVVDPGQTVTFTILGIVEHNPVTDAVVTDTLPVGQTYVDGTQASDPAADSFTVSPDGRTLTWTYANLDIGDPAVTITYDVTIDEDANGALTNVAELCVSEVPTCESDDETVTPSPELGIEKSNNAPIETIDLGDGTTVDLPTAEEGATVTYTLHYTVKESVTNAIITDVLPEGITYVDGTASNDAQFTFVSYDDETRTLTWTAPKVDEDGTLTYDAKVDVGAADLDQPLINVATIRSDQTPPVDDDSPVFVPPVPQELTPPPTDTLAPSTTASNPGFALMLILLAVAGMALAIGFITPVPEHVRRRDRLG